MQHADTGVLPCALHAACCMLNATMIPDNVQADYPLSRLTTVRAGGPADLFARPPSENQLLALLRWAAGEGVEVGVVGSGSNLLISDEGFRGLVLKLDGELAAVEREGTRVVCGGAARLPSATAKVARWGLAGLEFGIKTFGSTFKNPDDDERAEGRTAGHLLEAAGCQDLQVGGARFSSKHANFVENASEATTADILALMAEGRRRVYERFGVALEPEVQVLGNVEWPQGWDLLGNGKQAGAGPG